MRLLVLGGTGVMGTPLVKLLSEDNKNIVYVISRHYVKFENNVRQIVGNAFDIDFLKKILVEKYDAIVDFLWYDENSLPKSLPLLLAATNQYISLSSAAVYSDSDEFINEDTPRVMDIASKEETAKSKEYHFVKARTEDIVKSSRSKNWTIVRPHITFNKTRIPFCTWEMNVWLFRAVNGLPLAIPKDCLEKKTTLTYGCQVASQIKNLIGRKEALGEIFQLGSEDVYSWGEILEIYKKVLEAKGSSFTTVMVTSSQIARELPYMKCRFQFDRLLNRTFSTLKYRAITGDLTNYPTLEEGLIESLTSVTWGGKIPWTDAIINAKHDRIIGYWMPLSYLNVLGKYIYILTHIGVKESFVMFTVRILIKLKAILLKML